MVGYLGVRVEGRGVRGEERVLRVGVRVEGRGEG